MLNQPEMIERRKVFENMPEYIKIGFKYSEKVKFNYFLVLRY